MQVEDREYWQLGTFWGRMSCLFFGHRPFREFERRGFLMMEMSVTSLTSEEFLPAKIGVTVQCCGKCGVLFVRDVFTVENVSQEVATN